MKRSIRIEAPVETVFEFVKDPTNDNLDPFGTQVDDVKVTKEGVGTYYSWHGKIAGLTPAITLSTYVGEWPDTDQETSAIMDAALGQVPRMCPPAKRRG